MLVATHAPSMRARILDITPLHEVRAGSAVVWADDRLLVVQDDATSAFWIDPVTGVATRLILEGDGAPLSKADKPDYEAAFVGFGGTIYIVGSGSSPKRRRVARFDPWSAAGTAIEHFDCPRLFDALAAALGDTPNIEGAVLLQGTVRLFHRGAGGRPSATADVPLGALEGGPAAVRDVIRHDLGAVNGVALTFTDAAPIGRRDAILYLAVAEDTPNAIDDGPIVGAAVGVIEAGAARYALLEEPDGSPSLRKIEGVAIDAGSNRGFLVTDPDDPNCPAELCRFMIEGI